MAGPSRCSHFWKTPRLTRSLTATVRHSMCPTAELPLRRFRSTAARCSLEWAMHLFADGATHFLDAQTLRMVYDAFATRAKADTWRQSLTPRG